MYEVAADSIYGELVTLSGGVDSIVKTAQSSPDRSSL
jgi:hypothetical protein